jgi:flagellar hook-associated protein 1 FlgK
VADNRNALLLAGLQTTNTVANGTASYQGAYSQIVSDVGDQGSEIQVQSNAQDALVQQTTNAQQSFSGVNLDEEAANLIRYQQAYQASGKVLAIASQLFNTILGINS